MNFDPYNQQPIHQNGIWQSGCLMHENQIQQTIYDYLQNHGWQQDNQLHRIWRRNDRTVIVCLVDDIRSCTQDYHRDLPYIFDSKTTIITDNHIICPTQYNIIRLPASFFGIYSIDQIPHAWQPERLFTVSINRIDQRRLKLMLELGKKIYIDKGYVNFNCQKDNSLPTLVDNFDHFYRELSAQDSELWSSSYQTLRPRMPLKNYDLDHTEIFTRSWINVECETYSSDTSSAFSEKIFRLLTMPVPWMAYMGHYGVAYLESLGFDCVHDVINHNHYDRLKEVENKIGVFVWLALKTARELRDQDAARLLRDRFQQAATHNRALLRSFRQTWPRDFAQWQAQYLPLLA